MNDIIAANQNAFVRGRTIHDNFKYVQRAAVLLRQKKVPKALLKLDIAKAFDTIDWTFLLDVLEAMGFGQHWRRWIASMLSSATSKIMLNGQPGKLIKHRRGVRQGDSLSPLLFIIGMEILSRLFKLAMDEGVLRAMGCEGVQFQCSIYADDVILFIHPSIQEASAIEGILKIFEETSGLRTNMSKCSITNIFGAEDTLEQIRLLLGCQVLPFPIRYLGLPLSTGRIPKAHIQNTVEAVARRLPASHGPLMAKSGRLIWVKSVLAAVPIYCMIAGGLPAWAKSEIDTICRRFLWAGKDGDVRGRCMVAWRACTRPKELGGLGIPDFKLVALAFEVKWLWLQRIDLDRAWSALPLKMTCEAGAFFRASTYTIVGDGRSTIFWLDSWLNGVSLRTSAPTLFQYIPKRTSERLTVAEALPNRHWAQLIYGGVSVQATIEYLQIWHQTTNVHLTDVPDQLVWRWQSDGKFSVRSAYLALHHGANPIPGCILIWEIWAPLRVKFFLWLALRRRHWTADRRRRHGLDAHDLCLLCGQEPESMDHIVVDCSFSRQLWFKAAHALGVHLPQNPAGSLLEWWSQWRSLWTGDMRKGADTLFALLAWEIWKERNARCFRGAESNIDTLIATIRYMADLWVSAGATHLGSLLARIVG
jgi:hypothetical protein